MTLNASTQGAVQPATAPATPSQAPAAVTPSPAPAAPAVGEPNLRAHGKLSLANLEGNLAPAAPAAPAAEAQPAVPAAEAKPGEPAVAPAVEPAAAEPPAPVVTVPPVVLKTKTGREFKEPAELLTAYENSSAEGLRLSAETKTLKLAQEDMASKLQAANNVILELQSVAGTGLFPGLKNDTELESMSEEDRQNYYLDKRDWNKRQEEIKARVMAAKEESEKFATRVQEEMKRNDQLMASDPAKFPDYQQLEPLRNEILSKAPHMANRPDSHYNAYVMAMGLTKMQELEQSRSLTEKARADAAAKADSVSRQAREGAPPPVVVQPAPKSTGFEKLIEVGQRKRSGY